LIVNTEDAHEIRRFQGCRTLANLADPQTKLPGTIFEGLYIAPAGRRKTYQGRIDPCLNHTIEPGQIA